MRTFTFSGRIGPDNLAHGSPEALPDGAIIAPVYEVRSNWPHPIAVYGPLVVDESTGYDPAGNCGGNFMSAKYQPNNNCYAYGCNITPNSFPQPGRFSNCPDIFANGHIAPIEAIVSGAEHDGLILVGTTLAEVEAFAADNPAPGHFVALMYSPAEDDIGQDTHATWPGDYHWARCDDLAASSWSQKDGSDQVTNFDFAGQPITNPATADWRVNQGPIGTVSGFADDNEYLVTYGFHCFMYVPYGAVNIL